MAKILIAEDDDTVRAFLVRALGGDGHDLIEPQTAPLPLTRSMRPTAELICF
jgi:CheY-like chemotaxis protein